MLYATYPVKSAVVGATFGFDNILIAFHGLIFYPWKFLAPFHLSSLYPYPGRLGDSLPIEFTISLVVVLIALVLGIDLFAIVLRSMVRRKKRW